MTSVVQPVGGAPQRPIGDYALIGDTRAAALSSSDGSIDWLCLPRMDSDPVFGALVAGPEGGHFRIAPTGRGPVRRRYRDDSAILETTWSNVSGEVRLTEGMVLDVSSSLMPQMTLVRRVEARGDPGGVRIEFVPRRGFGGSAPRFRRHGSALVAAWGPLAVSLQASTGAVVRPDESVEWVLDEGPLTLVMGMADRQPIVLLDPDAAWRKLKDCDRWWKEWCGRIEYDGPHREQVVRSLITMRLLTYSPSGAPVAAPTTSLPEGIGSDRTWDYRLSWPRDAGLGISAFLGVGLREEAEAYLHWLNHAARLSRPRLNPVYSIVGRPGPAEREVPDIPGYRGSRPVRVGNDASRQVQHDVYGWVLDAARAMAQGPGGLEPAIRRSILPFADHVAVHWREQDSGIWEVRDRPAQVVHSKVWAWLALDRALALGDHRVSGRRRRRWAQARAAVAADVRARGFDADRGTYTREYGRPNLDAALLLMAGSGFEPSDSPRMPGTVEAIGSELGAGRSLLYRYLPEREDRAPPEGAFVACSFWRARALAHLGRREEAASTFEEMCGLANEVGLFAEEIDPATGEHLGNFPQVLSHSSLVHAALAVWSPDG